MIPYARIAALGLSVLAICGLGCARLRPDVKPSEARPGEVRIEMAGPGEAAILVPVVINGQGPYKFVLDTGATLIVIDPKLAQSLALPEAAGQTGYGAGIGQAGSIKLVRARSLQVGTATAQDVTLGVLDMQMLSMIGPDVKGLLGLNFLKSYRVTLDFERKSLRLDSPSP